MDYGKLFFCGFDDFNDEVVEIIEKYSPAGILIYPGLLSKEYLFLDFLNFLSKKGKFLVSSDHEGGQLEVLKYIPSSPGNLSLGRVDSSYTEKYCELSGKIMNVLGFNMVFAPVLDLFFKGSAPVVDLRSFGSDPKLVAQHGLKACSGYLRSGVFPCVKHYPGHGRAKKDSHYELPEVDATLEELWETDLYPFRRVLEEVKDATVMTAHIRYPKIDDLPATLSKVLIKDILRERIGFKGLVVSDAMEMKAISANFSVEEIVKLFFQAGGNMILLSDYRNLPVYYETLKRLVKDEEIEKDVLERSVKIVEEYLRKAKFSGGFGFLSEVSEKALLFKEDVSLSNEEEVVVLVPSSENLSPADLTGLDYDEIPKVVSRFFKVKEVIRYNVTKGPEKKVENGLILDFVVNASMNEEALKAHLELPAEKTTYFVIRNPSDWKHFKDRRFVVTLSTKPLSIYKALRHLVGRCDA
ncbi:glycoside hydrolase family 3 N-terminal domain-containing protein [Thermotoga sp. KOL6]|uniref:glycoside hydrolase family 3 N-terminal domain-containing protein n=1 Tax=Thermotoga sp. KOL6 TaxID=126741 RepID=UPI000C789F31|nr:glycoside hydrolase family 3 N-terminal domain-containing protein [Thermotoga sp. KOL6]PLV58296.1 hydrolase [Thermotoga sp. KOL6]